MSVAMLKVCFDESGHGRKGDFYSMAGVLSTYSQWRGFYADWRKALHEGRHIDYFKMNEAAARSGQFDKKKGWTKRLVNEKVERLTDVLLDNETCNVVAVVPMLVYRRIIRTLQLPLKYEDPYIACFFCSMLGVAGALNSLPGKHSKPMFVYDEQSDFLENLCGALFRWFRSQDAKQDPHNVVKWLGAGPFFHEDKHQEIGIQAADLVAWHFRTMPWEKQFKPWRKRPFMGKIGRVPFRGLALNEQQLEAWRNNLQQFMLNNPAAPKIELD